MPESQQLEEVIAKWLIKWDSNGRVNDKVIDIVWERILEDARNEWLKDTHSLLIALQNWQGEKGERVVMELGRCFEDWDCKKCSYLVKCRSTVVHPLIQERKE